ncbi:protein of unknown function [Xenorhabdus poinarii G6]|uniref:Uncharacterized protein n=1 Tax=Xenorhabdus poinarii G6 TaxID=1354304 RepID=A0A068R1E2_9GAMM|nr:protein of unknown function [Xenorhabdus poinarii G6]
MLFYRFFCFTAKNQLGRRLMRGMELRDDAYWAGKYMMGGDEARPSTLINSKLF